MTQLVRSNGMKMNTGFVGTPHLLHALSESGYTDIAYNLLFQENFPSWLYSVNRGATTMWEHWDSIKEDGTFWDKKMNSFNHYAYGAGYGGNYIALAITDIPLDPAATYTFTLTPYVTYHGGETVFSETSHKITVSFNDYQMNIGCEK